MYKVICGLNGAYPDPETIVWPVCQPTHCTDAIPTISGFKTGKWPSVIHRSLVDYLAQVIKAKNYPTTFYCIFQLVWVSQIYLESFENRSNEICINEICIRWELPVIEQSKKTWKNVVWNCLEPTLTLYFLSWRQKLY